jgi:hypothetical protein
MFLLLVVLLNFSGCSPEWHVTITGFDATGNPIFCVTQWRGCSGWNASLQHFYVTEVALPGSSAPPERVVWSIWAPNAQRVGKFTYGVIPKGWQQRVAPEPLKLDTFYAVGFYYFRLQKDAHGALRAEVLDGGEFNRKFKWRCSAATPCKPEP